LLEKPTCTLDSTCLWNESQPEISGYKLKYINNFLRKNKFIRIWYCSQTGHFDEQYHHPTLPNYLRLFNIWILIDIIDFVVTVYFSGDPFIWKFVCPTVLTIPMRRPKFIFICNRPSKCVCFVIVFSQHMGTKHPLTKEDEPVDYFSQLSTTNTDCLIDLIVRETNMYVRQLSSLESKSGGDLRIQIMMSNLQI
jgi:hypothetical protein